MKISFNAKNNRDAPYDLIRKEINLAFKISSSLADEILNRKNKKYNDQDSFLLRKDLLGMYIVSCHQEPVVVTYIDLSSHHKQNIISKNFDIKKLIEENIKNKINLNISLSEAVIKKFSLANLDLIKLSAKDNVMKFCYIENYPASFGFEVILDGRPAYFRISKKDTAKNCNITIDDGVK